MMESIHNVPATDASHSKHWQDNTPSDIDNLTDDEILYLIFRKYQSAQSMYDEYGIDGAQLLFHITKGTVAKMAEDMEESRIFDASEANAMRIVAAQTTIPVPRVRRVVRGKGNNFIIMDYIPGRKLSDIWPDMSSEKKAWVFETLKDYVAQLRAIRHPRSEVPGPVAPERQARICFSPIFGNIVTTRGPFPTYQAMADFFNKSNLSWAKFALKRSNPAIPVDESVVLDSITPFNMSWPLVLSHQDITPSNIILGDDGRLWLIDWGWAGFYPIWFEAIAMKWQAENQERVMKREDPLWASMIPYICGEFPEEEAWYEDMCCSLNWM